MPNLTNGSCMVVHWVAANLPFTNTSKRCVAVTQFNLAGGCYKYFPTNSMPCGNGSDRTQYTAE
jgi:hypothetical protein